ncbi:restriction endonuclease subunit S [Lacticaseibacillus rhamnosus]|uniref:restriction endonuclease subunit S n=1 Tax=Lacticaseibacillus rhamnosus TaxID=47715 RepID=UPI001107EDD9|nr:restriction endonuclease subunit S [Lacticaseibacillus rhamnosus]TLQ22426.1 restriction endonuclease subunit S [Lacticaseibacillus rhamnosus]
MKDNQAKYPQLRFKGFTDPWDKRYLGDYVVDYTEKTTQENQFPVLTSSQQQGIVLQSEYFSDRQVTTDENIGYFVLPRGYFTYRSRSDNNIFVFNRNDIIDKGIISYFYPVFGLISADSNFFLRRINNGLNRQLAIAAEGTGQHVLSLKKFKKMETRFPSLPEQKQIGEFLECLDDLITVNQRKLAKLKELKQGYLQKLFPRNGSKFPQLRFAGFADAWEQRKLSDFSKTTYGGGTPKTAVTEYWDGNIPWIQSSNLTVDDVQEVNLDKFITDDAIKNSAAKLIPANSIAIVTRVGVGKLTLMKQEFSTSQDFLSLSELHVDEQFGLYSIYKLLQKELNNIQGTSIKGMTKADLLTKDIMIPVEKDEQIKIGSFFKQLDHLITLHQRKLEKLQELKKGYLQKMFC